ncbi:MAG: DUF726 domain-containing protein [Sulfurimonadaceae bacterium]|jgi:hypothetical protein|nr:DUF726 domain-containing protein [Arcobacteraceae bacterium]
MFDSMKEKVGNVTKKAKEIANETKNKLNETIDEGIEKISDDYIDSNIEEINSYCSWCFEKTTVTLKEKNNFSRNIYVCNNCNKEVVKCRVCDNKAKYSKNKNDDVGVWSNSFCSVHEGLISKFETLNWSLNTIGEYRDILERDERDYKKICTTAAFTIGGAAVLAPAALLAAPAVGGAIGTSMLGLSGAAATNAGLATLGGGALAAGGAGMAGGVAVVTAAGSALGGRYGAIISSSYFGDIDGFEIVRIQPGKGPSVLCIDGFLTEGDKKAGQKWLDAIEDKYKNNTIYHIRWESKKLAELAKLASCILAKGKVTDSTISMALSATKVAAKKILPIGLAIQALGLLDNPWSVASLKAYQTGAVLADIIARTDKEYILIGHSLGARVIYSCLSSLKTKDSIYIKEAHLLGGAVNNTVINDDSSNERVNWNGINKAVSDKIYNYYSKNDDVLKYLYTVGESVKFENGDPIGRNEINSDYITNIDVSDYISGHTKYKDNLSKFIKA